MKEFLKLYEKEKYNKDDLAELIYEFQDNIIQYYIKKSYLSSKPNFVEVFNSLYDIMKKKKFVKALRIIMKEDRMELDCGFVVIITGFLEKFHNSEDVSEEIISEYSSIVNKLLKKRIKEIRSDVKIDQDVITELLVIAPSRKYISDDKFVGVYSQKMLKKLYLLSATRNLEIDNTKKIKKLFKVIFGKELLDLIAINILLEKKETLKGLNDQQQVVWNMMTTFALDIIEKEGKEHIRELMEEYCRRRKLDNKNQRDGARRIQLTSIDSEYYPTLAKIIGKMAKNEDFESYL